MNKVTIITIGDELLIGQVVDTNAAFMARQLNLEGIEVHRKITTSDELAHIQAHLQQALADSDAVLMTGGLGPTKDDITKKALADFFGVGMRFDEPTWNRIRRLFERWGRSTTEAHREQCYMPENAELLHNKMGTAPGMWFEQGNKIVVSMPGVPYEMEYLMLNEVLPRLRQKMNVRPIVHRTLLTAGEGESRLADRIAGIVDEFPEHLKMAYLPNLGQVRLRLTGRGDNEAALRADVQAYGDEIKAIIPEFVFGEGEQKLEAVIGDLLKERGQNLATAESCTGGYLAHRITAIAGSSAYYQGSIVAYDNDIKESLLRVKHDTLVTHGAVSEATVREMADGILELLDVDVAVAISGIAGPDGGTTEKPVGTIWMAVTDGHAVETMLLHTGKDRGKNIEYAASRALSMLWRFLVEHPGPKTES